MDPTELLHVYLSLVVPKDNISKAVSLLRVYQEQWPQSTVSLAGLRKDFGDFRIIVDVTMGEGRSALRGDSAEVHAGYGFIYTIVKNMFHYRPTFSQEPTKAEELFLETFLNGIPEETPTQSDGETAPPNTEKESVSSTTIPSAPLR